MESNGRTSKVTMKALNSMIENKDLLLSTTARTPDVSVAAVRMSTLLTKKKDNKKKILKSNNQKQEISSSKGSPSIVSTSQTCTTLVGSLRVVNSRVGDAVHESSANANKKDYPVKKLSDEIDKRSINYRTEMDFKETTVLSVVTNQDYESRRGNAINDTLFDRTSVQALQRDDPTCSNVQSRPVSRNESTAFAVAKRALELQKKPLTKISQIIFPPLRAPQSIVNVRHPSITDPKITKHDEMIGPINESTRELERDKETCNDHDTSQISSISNLRNPSNVALSQFTQSPSFNTTQIGESNQHQNYDPDDSFTASPVNDNPTIPRSSAENSVPCTQYENPSEFVQTNRYSATDRPNSQYQCQSTGIGKIQNATMFIRNLKSLRSPINVTERRAANSTKTVKAEPTSRTKMPSKSNK